MVFTKRDPARGIAEFWRWWPTAREQVTRSITDGWDDALVARVDALVIAIHPDLQWEFGRGEVSQHILVVSSGGNPALRATAERWRAAAPPADETWSFHSSRQADPSALENTLQLDGRSVVLAEVRFGVTLDRERREVDVTTYHPVFAQLPEPARLRVTYLVLDWALGEDAVELWLGSVAAVVEPPQRPQTVRGLAVAVAELADKQTDDMWALLGGHDGRGVPMTAAIQTPLRAVRWPRFDTHVAVTLPYRHRLPNGAPADDSLAGLRFFEDDLARRVGGDGALVAHESCNGRRTLHFYVDALSPATTTLRAAATDWPEGRSTVRTTHDPAFKAVAHLRA